MKEHKLSNSEQQQSEKYTSREAFQEYVAREQSDAKKADLPWKPTLLTNTVQLARQLAALEALLDDLTEPSADDDEPVNVKAINASPLWQLAFLNVKVRPVSLAIQVGS